jgi:ATP-dependent protease HslVU (ClpYQ) peptidase subunit
MSNAEPLQYAKRDHMALGDLYVRHVSAMTGEGLHSKSAIAAELAWRDAEIERLRKALAVIDKHSINTIRTGSKDVFDWIDDMAYVGKVAREALPAAPQPAA